jgi:hypothetical protein
MIEEAADLSVGLDGAAAVRFSTVGESIAPQWRLSQPSVTPRVEALREAWFDRQSAVTVKYVTAGLAYLEIDFPKTDHFIDALAGSRSLTLQTAPARKVIDEFGRNKVVPAEMTRFVVDDTIDLASGLRACLRSVGHHQSFQPTAVAPVSKANNAKAETLQDEIRERHSDVAATEKNQPDSAALARALLRLADAQAHAFQLSEARENYRKGLSLAAQYRADSQEYAYELDRLLWVDLELEQLDEAEKLAKSTPNPRLWLAAITVMRGDNASGREQFLTLLDEVLGQSFASLQAFKEWILNSDATMAPEKLKYVRELLLLWAYSALGEEDWISHDAFHLFYGENNGPHGNGSLIPAALISEAVFTCLDPATIQDGTTIDSTTRTILGDAAFIRGDSLRRAGDLAAVASDFNYAESELSDIPEAQGWTERVSVARLSLASELGFDNATTLRKAEAELKSAELKFGQESEISLEAASIVAELKLRLGDAAGAEKTALDAAGVASWALSDVHSLTMKLRLQAGAARYAQGDLVGSGNLAAFALGFVAPPKVPLDRLMGLNKDSAATGLRELSSLLETQPPGRLDAPVVERIQARSAEHLLERVLPDLPVGERPTLLAVLALARAKDFALRDADRKNPSLGSHLNGPPDTLVGLPQGLEFQRPSDTLNLSPLDVVALRQFAADFLRPDLLVPSDFRPTLRYGAQLDALECLMRALHRRFEASGTSETDRKTTLDTALLLAAAASRGDASATISAHFFSSASGIWGVKMGNPDTTREAVSTALFAWRLRSLLNMQLNHPLGVDNDAERRRLYVRTLSYVAYASSRMTEAFTGNGAQIFSYLSGTEYGDYYVNLHAYAENLAPHQAVVIWLPLESYTDVFVIGPQETAWHEIPEGRRMLASRVEKIRGAIQVPSKPFSDGPSQSNQTRFPSNDALGLYKILFGPVLSTPEQKYITEPE